MSAPDFEIGVVYRKSSRLYLAVTNRELINYRDGQLTVVRPYQRYEVIRHISVEELCERWNIKSTELDAQTIAYLAPSAEGIKPRPRGSRESRLIDEYNWQRRRTIRLAS